METPEGSKMKRSRDVGDAGRCSKQSSKRSYGPKKKRFAGNRYTNTKKDGRDSAKVVAEKSTNNAAAELKKGIVVIRVTVDGTWQRRGYTSMNGVVVALSIDSENWTLNYSIL